MQSSSPVASTASFRQVRRQGYLMSVEMQAGSPVLRYAEFAAVRQFQPHHGFIKAQVNCRNVHAMPFLSRLCVLPLSAPVYSAPCLCIPDCSPNSQGAAKIWRIEKFLAWLSTSTSLLGVAGCKSAQNQSTEVLTVAMARYRRDTMESSLRSQP